MKRLLTLSRTLLATASLMILASAASAGVATGINLSWDECGVGGVAQKNFACTTNSGVSTLYASVVVGTNMDQLNGHAGVIDLQTNEAALSAWWQIGTGQCRAVTAISADFNFLAAPGGCFDPWQGSGAGGVNYQIAFNGPNRGRIRTVCAIPGSTSITGTDEWYMFKVNINNSRSTGTGACAGCSDGACIVLNSILVTQPAVVGDDRTFDLPFGQRHVFWQPGGNSIGGLGCPNEVPVRTQTWGSVKSLYR